MRNAGLDEAQTRIKIARRNISNLRYADDTTLMAESDELKSLLMKVKEESESEVAQSCPTLSDPMDCSLPGSSIHGIFQAGVLEWGAIAFSDICCYHAINNNSKSSFPGGTGVKNLPADAKI